MPPRLRRRPVSSISVRRRCRVMTQIAVRTAMATIPPISTARWATTQARTESKPSANDMEVPPASHAKAQGPEKH